MNKVRLTILCFALLFGISSCTKFAQLSTDSDVVTNIAAEITTIDLPDGYYSDFAVMILDYKMSAFINGDNQSHIYLIQSENDSDGSKLLQMLDKLVPGSRNLQSRMTVTDIRQMIIKKQETEAIFCEGTNSNGKKYSQMIVPFQGKDGPAMLVFSEPISVWNIDTVNNLVNSIR